MTPAIELEDISFSYRGRPRLFGPRPTHKALHGVTFQARRGECVGVIGESGSGKSTLARIITGIHHPDAGHVAINGEAIGTLKRPLHLRRAVQMVFQNPNASLDPTWPVWACIAEGLLIDDAPRPTARARALEILDLVKLDRSLADRRPHELSGGQRQRVAIGRALAVDPDMLILDEPTSALDLTVQAGVLNLLLDLQESRSLTLVFISHDIDVIRHLSERVYVMKDGRVVEHGAAGSVLSDPQDAYTRALIAAAPRIERSPA